MSAREELHESMCGSCCGRFARGECESVDRLIDAFVHELAEQIRTESEEWSGWPGKQATMRYTADLIDPSA